MPSFGPDEFSSTFNRFPQLKFDHRSINPHGVHGQMKEVEIFATITKYRVQHTSG